MVTLPMVLKAHINPAALSYVDLLDLLTISAEALKQCYSNDYASMDLQNAIESSDCINDAFDGIRETDEFCESILDRNEWAQVSQWAAQTLSVKDPLSMGVK
jgi:hypothetical protein